MDLGFTDATAVVTGGSKGMGRAIAECLPPLMPAIAEAIDHIAGFRPKLK